MTANAEQKTSALDYIMLVLALVALVAGVYGYYYFEETSVFYGTGVVLGGVVAALGLLYATNIGKVMWSYVRAANTERRKVVWPTRQETLQTLLVVSVMVGIISIYLWLVDKAAGYGVEKVLL